MASRALTHRFSSALSSWVGSTSASQSLHPSMTCNSICSLSVRRRKFSHAAKQLIDVDRPGLQGLEAGKGQHAVSQFRSLPGSVCNQFRHLAQMRVLFTSSAMTSEQPRITVSRLLKSWAIPPVNWPMASIFCAWRNSLLKLESIFFTPIDFQCERHIHRHLVEQFGFVLVEEGELACIHAEYANGFVIDAERKCRHRAVPDAYGVIFPRPVEFVLNVIADSMLPRSHAARSRSRAMVGVAHIDLHVVKIAIDQSAVMRWVPAFGFWDRSFRSRPCGIFPSPRRCGRRLQALPQDSSPERWFR